MSKAFVRSIKNVTSGYSNSQIMVRNATSNEAYGPSTLEMEDVARHTFDNGEFLEIMDMVDKRLNDKGKNWRHVAKSLTLLDYLVRFGSENVVLWAKDNLYIVKTLREFQFSDESGSDKGAVIRVKAKELTSLLLDDERLRTERELARNAMKTRRTRPRRAYSRGEDAPEYDADLQAALEASRMTAEEEEGRRRLGSDSDESLQRAIQLSKEEEEMRKRRGEDNLLDLNDGVAGYDMFGNPIYQNSMNTGYLQNAYSDQMQQQMMQQQMQEQQMREQQMREQQMREQQMQEQMMQQQMMQQQQQQQYYQMMQQQQQQQMWQQQQAQQQQPLQTGSNNPFAVQDSKPSTAASFPAQTTTPDNSLFGNQTAPVRPQSTGSQSTGSQSTGSQRFNQQHSELNNLLASGTGIDTFGNTGETRIPAQHTRTGTFVNSSGRGFKQETHSANPFVAQYTGVPATNIVPAHTGYGFGNAQQKQEQPSLIDM